MNINGILDANIRCGEGHVIAVSNFKSERWVGPRAQAVVLRRQVAVSGRSLRQLPPQWTAITLKYSAASITN